MPGGLGAAVCRAGGRPASHARSPSPIPAATSPSCCAAVSSWSSSGGGARPWRTTRTPSANTPTTPRCNSGSTPPGSTTIWNAATPTGASATSVLRLSTERALELYSQVLLKIESHYVEAAALEGIGRAGDAATWRWPWASRPSSTGTFPRAIGRRSTPFAASCGAIVGARTVGSRRDARDAVAAVARLAQQRLEIAPGRRRAGVPLRRDQRARSLFRLPHARSTERSVRPDRRQFRRAGRGVEGPGRRAGDRAGDLRQSRRRGRRPRRATGSWPIDGQPTSDLTTDQAANLLQGAEGSVVALTLAAPGQPPRQLSVRRRRVEVPSVDQVGIIDPQYGIGYFKLTCFQKTTARDLDAALWKLHREGMKSLVIDVRGNPGGLLVSAVEVVDRFVERGDHRLDPRPQRPGRLHLLGPRAGQVADAAGGDHRPGQRQRGGDFRRGHPRPPPRHDRRRAELRQGVGPGHLPLGRIQRRRAADHGQVLFAQRAGRTAGVGVEPDIAVQPALHTLPPSRSTASFPPATTRC